jgi:hypothetical protein
MKHSVTKQLLAVKLITSLTLACTLAACTSNDFNSHFSGYHDQFYSGPSLPMNQIAVLVGQGPHVIEHSDFRIIDIRQINGVDKKRLATIELLPGKYNVCATLFINDGTYKYSSDGCVIVSFNALPGHIYETDAVLTKVGVESANWTPLMVDVTSEQGPHKQEVVEYIRNHRNE